jgi:hypothetical protein
MKLTIQYNYIQISILCLFASVFGQSCKKFVEIPSPSNQLISDNVFTSDATATATVLGIYSEMMNNPTQFCNASTTLYAGMSSDELYYYTPGNDDEFVKNQITQGNHGFISTAFWQSAYKYIYTSNLCIEQLNKTTLVSSSVKNELSGECKFIRAFCYFHLINLFGDVPLIISSDYRINSNLPRTPKVQIYQQIITDLLDAKSLLSATYQGTSKTRPNKWAAEALLARIYLYTQDWANAEIQATEVINSNTYNMESDLNKVFLQNNSEAIWQLQPVYPGYNTYEANKILPATSNSTPTYLLTNTLRNAFDTADHRKSAWIANRVYLGDTVYYPYKYKVYGNNAPLTEYYSVLRLAEQYLIRSESRAQQNNVLGAQNDLNVIRNRAGLSNTTTTIKSILLAEILHERQVELFSEWGQRWYDLKRTNQVDLILAAIKPTTWQPTDALWPIPQDQLNLNPSLTQNPGY